MNKFETDSEMELVLQAKRNQPKLFAQLPATTKIAVGIYASTKPSTNGLSADNRLRLTGLKQRIAQDVLSPQERTSLALEIQNLEITIGEK
jgi:regulation of enolase protein 1 (concanavalin A-like superfamily)